MDEGGGPPDAAPKNLFSLEASHTEDESDSSSQPTVKLSPLLTHEQRQLWLPEDSPLNSRETPCESEANAAPPSLSLFTPPLESLPASQASLSLTAQVLEAQGEIVRLRRELLSKHTRVQEAEWRAEQLQCAAKEAQHSLKTAKQTVMELRQEVDSLRQRCLRSDARCEEELRKSLDLEGRLQAMEAAQDVKMKSVTSELETLQAAHAAREVELTTEIKSLTEQLGLAAKRSVHQESAYMLVQSNFEEINERASRLEEELLQKDEQLARKESRISDLSQRNTAMHFELVKLREQAAPPTTSRHILASEALQKLHETQQELENLRVAYKRLEDKYKIDSESLVHSLNTNRDASEEVLDLRRRLLVMDNTIQQLTNELQEQREARTNLEHQLCDLNVDFSRLKRMKSSLEDQLAKALSSDSRDDAIREIVAENEELKEAVKTLQRSAEVHARQRARELELKIDAMEVCIQKHGEEKTELIEELNDKKQKAERKQEELVRHITDLEERIRRSQTIEEDFEREKRKWIDELTGHRQRLQQASHQIQNLNENIQGLGAQRMEAIMKIASKDAEIRFLKGQLEREEARCQTLMRSVDEQIQQKQRSHQEVTRMKESEEQYKTKLEAYESEKEEFERKVEQARWAKSLMEEEVNLLKTELRVAAKQRHESRASLEAQVIRLQGWIKQLQAEKEELKERLRDKELALDKSTEQIQLTAIQVQKLHTEIAELNNKRTEQEMALAASHSQVEEATRQINIRDGHIQSLKHDMNLLYERMERNATSLSTETPRQDSSVPRSANPQRESEQLSISPDTEALHNHIQTLEKELVSKENLLSKAREALKELEEENNGRLKPGVLRLEKEIGILEMKKSAHDAAIVSLEAAMKEKDERLMSLETSLNGKVSEVQTLRNSLSEQENTNKELNLKLADVEKAHRNEASEIEQVRNAYRFVVEAHGADLKRLEESKNEREELLTAITALKSELATHESEVQRERADFEKYTSKLKLELESIKSEKAEIERDMQQLADEHQGDLSSGSDKALQIKSEQLRKKCEVLQSNVDDIQLENTQLKIRNESLESMVKQLEVKLNQNNESVRELRRKLQSQATLLSPDLLIEKTSLERQVQALSSSNELLETRLKDVENLLETERRMQLPMRSKVDKLTAEIQILEQEIVRLKAADTEWQDQYTSLLSSYNGIEPLSSKLKEELLIKNQEIEELKKSYVAGEAEIKKRADTALRLQSLLQAKERQIEKISSQLSSMQTESESTVESLKQANSALQSKLTEIESEKSESGVQELQNQLDAVRRANELLRQQRTVKPLPKSNVHVQTDAPLRPAFEASPRNIPPGLLDAIKQLARLAARQYLQVKACELNSRIVREAEPHLVGNPKKRLRQEGSSEILSEPMNKKINKEVDRLPSGSDKTATTSNPLQSPPSRVNVGTPNSASRTTKPR